MTGPSLYDQFLKEQSPPPSGPSGGSLYAQYLSTTGKSTVPSVKPDVTSALARNRENPSGDMGVLGRGVAANVLNAAQGIPGMEAFEAGMGVAGSHLPGNTPLSYPQSLAALRSQTKSIPGYLRVPEKMLAGGRVIGSLLPSAATATMLKSIGTGAGVGAGLGAADALADADPTVDLKSRLQSAGVRGAVGAVVGGGLGAVPGLYDKAKELTGLKSRLAQAPTLGRQAVDRANDLSDTDARNFGLVRAQAAANPTSPILQKTLNDPVIAPYVQMVRSQSEFQSASDADVALEADKLMSEDRGGLRKTLAREPSAEVRLKERNIGSAQQRLKSALSSPSEKPPLTLDVAGETTETNPVYSFGHEAQTGPVLPGTAGRYRGDQSQVAVDPSGKATSVAPRDVQGPMGPAFMLRADPERMTRPGVSITTPDMHIQTAPAQPVGPVASAFPQAKAASSELRGQTKVFNDGYTDGLRIMRDRTLKDVNQAAKQSTEAITQRIQTMNPEDADQYLQGVLAAGKTAKNPLPSAHQTAFGTIARMARPAMQLNRLSPFVTALDQQKGVLPPLPTNPNDLLRLLGIGNAPLANP